MRRLIIIIGAGIFCGLLLALSLPSLLSALPSQVRVRLPEEVLRAITTPLPTALPPPISTAAAPPISVAELLPGTVPAAASATSSPLSTQTAAAVGAVSPTTAAVQTRTPATSSPTAAASRSASPTVTATAVPSAAPLPRSAQISGLRVTPQKFNNCGAANMSILLDYFGAPDTQIDIAARIKPHYDDRNVTPQELVDYVNEQTGLQAAVYRGGDFDLLRRLLQAGFPVIVEKGYEPNDWQGWMGHYLTLTGYDDEAEQFNSLDTFLGPWDSSGRPVSYDELARYWSHFNHTFLVVHRPLEAQLAADLLGPEYTNEAFMWQNAAAAAETAVSERPQDAFAWFSLGSNLAALGQINDDRALYAAAAAAFDQARIMGLPPRMLWYQFAPYEAYINSERLDEALALAAAVIESDGGWHVEESHYYQGAAYEAAGRIDLARSAYKRALEIKPGYHAARQALDDLAAN